MLFACSFHPAKQVRLTPLACRIAGAHTQIRTLSATAGLIEALPDACVAERLLLNIAGLICG